MYAVPITAADTCTDALAKLAASEQGPLFDANQKVDLTPAREAALRQQLSELDRLLADS